MSHDCYNMKLKSKDPLSNRFRIVKCVKSEAENLPCKQFHRSTLYLSCL